MVKGGLWKKRERMWWMGTGRWGSFFIASCLLLSPTVVMLKSSFFLSSYLTPLSLSSFFRTLPTGPTLPTPPCPLYPFPPFTDYYLHFLSTIHISFNHIYVDIDNNLKKKKNYICLNRVKYYLYINFYEYKTNEKIFYQFNVKKTQLSFEIEEEKWSHDLGYYLCSLRFKIVGSASIMIL